MTHVLHPSSHSAYGEEVLTLQFGELPGYILICFINTV